MSIFDRFVKKPKVVVVSGVKGGTGKSTFCTGIAKMLSKRGHKTILIDCDIEGSNCPRILGVTEAVHNARGDFEPVVVDENLSLYSMDLHPCIKRSDLPVVMLGESHRQFIQECLRASLKRQPEYIVMDLPAEHGDALHTVLSVVKSVEGFVLVSAPNKISTDNCENAIRAAKELNLPVLGVIENFAGLRCDCGRVHYPFGHGAAKEMAMKHHLRFLGEQMLDPRISTGADRGRAINNPIVTRICEILETGE